MSTKKRFMAVAEKAGIEVEYTSGRRSHPRTGEPVGWGITLDSPPGKIFRGSGCHVDCSFHGEGETNEIRPNWAKELTALDALIAEGFEDCEDDECDVCHPEEE